MKLTESQQELMNYVNESFKEPYRGDNYYYCETGSCKPWDRRVVEALVKKGVVTIERYCDNTVFYLRKNNATNKDYLEAINHMLNKMDLGSLHVVNREGLGSYAKAYHDTMKSLHKYEEGVRARAEQAKALREEKKQQAIAKAKTLFTEEELELKK
jgi:hypothetical protein